MITNPVLRRKLARTSFFGVYWFITSYVYVILERGLLGQLDYYPSTGNPYSFIDSLIFVPIISFFIGLVFGGLEVFVFNDLFRKRSLFFNVVFKTLIYVLLICLLLMIMTLIIGGITQNISIWHHINLNTLFLFSTNLSFWSVVIYIGFILTISLFLSEIGDYFGITTFTNFLIGKYQRPQREVRIFMFLDMKSSTTIAEAIGHVRYFELLKKYYADMSIPILNAEGKIYQYVGDEIVISWLLKNGLKNNNCLKCFYEIKMNIAHKSHEYFTSYGVIPTFKAGIHVGEVTTGEIGKIKKDIISTGDVLNTTARIQDMCNVYNAELLISKQLLDQLKINGEFEVAEMGEFLLKGKNKKIFLNSVTNLSQA